MRSASILCFWIWLFLPCGSGFANDTYAIATAHPAATRAGAAVLAEGGNAFDAAVAVTAMLSVVEPYSCGIGGGGFWLLYREQDRHSVMIDGRERAPLSASADMYLDENGKVIPGKSLNGSSAAGIPGVPAALVYISEHYGSLPLETLLSPAIKAARSGFAVDNRYQQRAKRKLRILRRYSASAATLLVNGNVPAIGQIIRQEQLARTLESIAKNGRNGFYGGQVAQDLVADVRGSGGIWSQADLQQYRIIGRAPLIFHYAGSTITTGSLPSSGGIVLNEIFNMLSLFDPQEWSPLSEHLLIEVMRRAYRDRASYLGDQDYVEVPSKRLRSLSHAKKLASTIHKDRASRSVALKTASPQKGLDTTHFSIADNHGNLVAATMSINTSFGSGYISPRTGVLLNNEMDDFSIQPGTANAYGLTGGEANAIAPGKRMLSSMSPSFVETHDRIAVLGTPGGSRIITMVLLGILEFLKGGGAQEIVSLKRFHHQYLPDVVETEPKVFTSPLLKSLKKMGHIFKPRGRNWGNMQAVVLDKFSGKLEAAADPRGIGMAIAENETGTKP